MATPTYSSFACSLFCEHVHAEPIFAPSVHRQNPLSWGSPRLGIPSTSRGAFRFTTFGWDFAASSLSFGVVLSIVTPDLEPLRGSPCAGDSARMTPATASAAQRTAEPTAQFAID